VIKLKSGPVAKRGNAFTLLLKRALAKVKELRRRMSDAAVGAASDISVLKAFMV
jgi:hypothetical protein